MTAKQRLKHNKWSIYENDNIDDLCVNVRGFCVWRGEEAGTEENGHDRIRTASNSEGKAKCKGCGDVVSGRHGDEQCQAEAGILQGIRSLPLGVR